MRIGHNLSFRVLTFKQARQTVATALSTRQWDGDWSTRLDIRLLLLLLLPFKRSFFLVVCTFRNDLVRLEHADYIRIEARSQPSGFTNGDTELALD